MKLNNIIKIGFILGIPALSIVSCTSSGNRTGIEYAPQMYVSDGYEPFSQEEGKVTYNPNNMTMRLPVNGTVARGQSNFAYPYPNTAEGYAASAAYTSFVSPTKSNVAEGERLYNINCWHCHGKSGKNDGPIFESKKMPTPSWPSYQDDYIKNLPEGQAFHTITCGKGLMGPHSFLLSPEERWKVVQYVKSLAYGDAFEYAPESSTNAHTASASSDESASSDSDAASGDNANGSSNSFPGSQEDYSMLMTAMSQVDFKGLPNRKAMKSSSFSALDKVAAYMTSHSDLKATILGHTGVTLTDEGAATLGMDRANTVIDYLVSKGVNRSALSARAVADAGMKGPVTSSSDRQANRRVEIEIYK